MFALTERDFGRRILGCGDGPASFNAELTRRGGKIVSTDPLYACSADDIRQRIEASFEEVMRETRNHQEQFIWQAIRSVEELGTVRRQAMDTFLADFPAGMAAGRYLAESAPDLCFADDSFALGLCSHFLFLYSDHLDLEFHIDCISELRRVCGEVRIFPLLQLNGKSSPHVESVCAHFRAQGHEVAKVRVPYEFQRGGNQMLQIRKAGHVD